MGRRAGGHPWLKPIRFHHSVPAGARRLGAGRAASTILPSVTDFFRVEGEEIHEVAVGPVHAGVIEPGHFRFQCHGEHVFHLEISLGFQHRGVERALVGGPNKRTIHYMETLAGDTSVGHATAYCQAVEALAVASRRSGRRCCAASRWNWSGWPTTRATWRAGRRRRLPADGVVLRPAARRFSERHRDDLRQPLRPQPGPARAAWPGTSTGRGSSRCSPGSKPALRDVDGAAELLWDSRSVQARFEDTGRVSQEVARPWAWSGSAARACGLDRDVRHDFPERHLPLRLDSRLDLAHRRRLRPGLRPLAGDPALGPVRPASSSRRCRPARSASLSAPLMPDSLVVSLVEGWRGEICHVAITDSRGRVRALQDRRPVVPQLDRPGDGAAESADLRLSAVQQELQPLVLRTRPLISVVRVPGSRRWCTDLYRRLACSRLSQNDCGKGIARSPIPRDVAATARSVSRPAVLDDSKCPDGCRGASTPARPTRSPATTDGLGLDMGRCLFCTDCIAAAPRGRSRSRRTIAWRPGRARI